MKKLFYLCCLALLASCTTDYGKCSKDEMYHNHNFKLMSIYPSYLEGHDGWLKEKCSKCGLEKAFNTGLKYTKHFGSVSLVKAPGSNNFSTWCVTYYENDRLVIKPISKTDVVVKKKTKEINEVEEAEVDSLFL